jgi:hypothetical protein
MTKKEEFVEQFKKETGKDAKSYKKNPKGFAKALNDGSKDLRRSYRAAVSEASPSEEDLAATGLSQLFGGL